MQSSERIKQIRKLLVIDYPIVLTPLIHKNIYQLFVAVLLSPQTTDNTTNKVTPKVFEKYKTFQQLANADFEELNSLLKNINYHKTKTKHLIESSKMIQKDFKGEVPSKLTELIKLPGVGRKVGNVIISEWYAKPLNKRGSPHLPVAEVEKMSGWEKQIVEPEGFVVDTHVIRTTNRLGLTKNKDPKKIEQDLMKIFPKEEWVEMSLRLIFHGRNRCTARDNRCCEDPDWKELCECS